MDVRQKERLEAYLRNCNRFLWGVRPWNQKMIYDWLDNKMHLQFTRGTYDDVTLQLLNNRNLGIEKVLENIIIPTVKEVFPEETITYLRDCWNHDGLPRDLNIIRGLKVNITVKKDRVGDENSVIWRPFIQINTLYQAIYVEGWGELAPIWFEEIEPWLTEKEATND